MGELCECFQWRPDASTTVGLPGWSDAGKIVLSAFFQTNSIKSQKKRVMMMMRTFLHSVCMCAHLSPADRHHLGEEMSDVLLYLVRLADKCDVDLADAVQKKIQRNAAKYPAHLVKAC